MVADAGTGSESVEALVQAVHRLRAEIGKRIVGQDAVVDEILMALVAGGHALLVGVPGLAKTMMVRAVSEAMQLDFRRIQFTPDLVPSDILGAEVLETGADGPQDHVLLHQLAHGLDQHRCRHRSLR
jgi:MoxR-like ATPase